MISRACGNPVFDLCPSEQFSSTKHRIKCLAQEHDAVPPGRLEPANTVSRVKHSTTPFLLSPLMYFYSGVSKKCFSVDVYIFVF